MTRRQWRWAVFLACIPVLEAGARNAADLQKITIEPSAGFISGPGGSHRFVVSGHYQDGFLADLTRDAVLTTSDPGVAKVGGAGAIISTAEGVARITAKFAGHSAEAALVVTPARPKTWQFYSDIAPIFSKLGCSNNSCHGALNGQSGFKLSLFGYDAPADYDAVVKHSDGRRINRSQPERSLILEKPSFGISHGGGKLMEKNSLEYTTLLQWIRDGAPMGAAGGPKLLSVQVLPGGFRVLENLSERQQIAALATYSDGSRADLTEKVRYVSSDETIATVSPSGLVTPKRNGEVSVLIRTLGHLDAMRVAVAVRPDLPVSANPPPVRNFVDEAVFAKLRKLKIAPAAPSTDAQFLRRVYLDTIGTLPTPEESLAFLKATDPKRRDKLIDTLLDRPEYAQFWALKWGDLFMIRDIFNMNNTPYAHEYFRRNFAEDRPYTDVAREMLTGLGPLAEVGPNNLYSREDRRPAEEYATLVSQSLLGVSLECARCHDHPKEKWKRDDFLGLAAFFSQVKMKERNGYRPFEGFVVLNYAAEFKHPQSRQVVRPRLLDGSEPVIGPMTDRRELLAQWVTAQANPFFARATVNRVWKQLFGKGIVDPVDDFRVTNPPSNPELLDRLAEYFIEHNFRFKPLMKLMLRSSTYQLASASNESNAGDSTNFSRYYVRKLTAEQLLDAVGDVSGVPERFQGFYRGKRAIDLPDPGVPSYFLATFNRPIRDTAKCERTGAPTITQAMHFMNGDAIQGKVASAEGRLHEMIAAGATDDRIIEHFYLAANSRSPKPEELVLAKSFISKQTNRELGLQGVVWALLNSKEFLFNH
ncbi:MAG TPA: DUF1553 domain-containing protein [Bryobacteraceae bacterium]|nr:DUF1553 domain-containing protein [Bryobacteraceae bacterium]